MNEQLQGQVPNASGQEPGITEQPSAAAGAPLGQEPEAERFDAEYVRKLRAEAAEYRRKLRELEQVVRQHEEAKLSERERLEKRLAELEREKIEWEQKKQEQTLRYETMIAASRLGIIDPEAAYRLLDLSKIEFDENDRPKNIEEALRDLVREKPYLAPQPMQPVGSPTNPATGQQRARIFTRSQIADRRFWEANREEILRAMAEGRIVEG